MSKQASKQQVPTINVATSAAQQVVTALTASKSAKERAAKAAKSLKAANGSVTQYVIGWAGELREQLGKRKVAVGGADGEYAAVRRFVIDNKGDKGLATNLAQLVCWLANDATLVDKGELVTYGDDGKPLSYVGWNKAHAAVKRLVNPPARSWKDTFGEAEELLGEEADVLKAAIAELSGRELVRILKQRLEDADAADEGDDTDESEDTDDTDDADE